MLEPRNHDGLLVVLFGISILGLLVVGLSLYLDQPFWLTRRALGDEVGQQAAEISRLEQHLATARSRMELVRENHAMELAEVDRMMRDHRAMGISKAGLEGECVRLVSEIERLEAALMVEKNRIRRNLWMAATGERMTRLDAGHGSRYEDVQILEVSEEGLLIRHVEGVALIRVADLPVEMRERFQYEP